MKVLVVAEYYPRAGDPVRGVWAHRQAVAARDAGAEVRVLVLHRPLPPLRRRAARALCGAFRELVAQPRHALPRRSRVDYVRYLSPPRPSATPRWGAWAAPALRRALRPRAGFPFDLIHAHYAVPAGDAVRRAARTPARRVGSRRRRVRRRLAERRRCGTTLAHARLVLANSDGTARRSAEHSARAATRVVHLGTDLPPAPRPRRPNRRSSRSAT